MKSMSKNVCIFLSLMFACTTLSACGSSENSYASENKSTEATSTAITQDATLGQKEGETYIGADYTGSPISIKAAHTGNENTTYQVGMLAFKDYVESHSNGKYTVDIFPSTLGGDSDLYEGLQIGTVDFAEVNTSVISSTVEDLKVLDLPFMFSTREQAYAVLDGEIGDKLLQEITDQAGIKAICFWENGFRDFTNNVHPIATPDDLKDLNMRCMQSDIYLNTFKNWGCNVSVMSISETVTAMQSGVIDGHDNNPDTVVANSMWEYQKYFSDSRHFYACKTLDFSQSFWSSLDSEEQNMFTEAAKYARDKERMECANRYDAALDKLKENGMEVTSHDEIDIDAFKESVQPIWSEYENTLGNLINEVKAVVDATN